VFRWGKYIDWCMALGGTEFCKWCLWWHYFWYKSVLGISPTLLFTPVRDTLAQLETKTPIPKGLKDQ
jgi:hypothetical protein